eukprot:scaffold51838_cov30-Prasinocladus_malaysianus.AAC.1
MQQTNICDYRIIIKQPETESNEVEESLSRKNCAYLEVSVVLLVLEPLRQLHDWVDKVDALVLHKDLPRQPVDLRVADRSPAVVGNLLRNAPRPLRHLLDLLLVHQQLGGLGQGAADGQLGPDARPPADGDCVVLYRRVFRVAKA